MRIVRRQGAQLVKLEQGALADLLLVDGNPRANINRIANPDKNFLVITNIPHDVR